MLITLEITSAHIFQVACFAWFGEWRSHVTSWFLELLFAIIVLRTPDYPIEKYLSDMALWSLATAEYLNLEWVASSLAGMSRAPAACIGRPRRPVGTSFGDSHMVHRCVVGSEPFTRMPQSLFSRDSRGGYFGFGMFANLRCGMLWDFRNKLNRWRCLACHSLYVEFWGRHRCF